ncbi:hypothetical protein Hypma_005548 [Hypsizygus marmoreus]|uniref:Uncharacterized protein n=1 Tax=Hypsizygus marmoreus TaxID=39966 RepID=A0A369JWA1_HYPMA|nr:hypothetical protein Hypma_005548 [Hypsizygus marmoreus]
MDDPSHASHITTFNWHRYFIPDIIRLICEQAYDGYDGLDTLVPLIKYLPSDIWEESDGILNLPRVIFHGRFVRQLEMRFLTNPGISANKFIE